MKRTFATFAAAPIGAGLLAGDGGLTLTTDAPGVNLNRKAISTVGHADGVHGAEFTFWGDADLNAVVGLAPSDADLHVGIVADGIGWLPADGDAYYAGDLIASDLPPVEKGDTIGVLLRDGVAEFYVGGTLILSHPIAAGTWHFAAAVGAAEAATLWAAVNAGQWQAAGPAAAAGWRPAAPVVPTVRISDIDHLDDDHQRWEGVIDASGISTVAALGFWPWGGGDPMQGAAAQLTINDVGTLDDLAQADVAGVPVAVRIGSEKIDSGVPTFRQPDEPQITGVRRNLFEGTEGDLSTYGAKGNALEVSPWNGFEIGIRGDDEEAGFYAYKRARPIGFEEGEYVFSAFIEMDSGDPPQPTRSTAISTGNLRILVAGGVAETEDTFVEHVRGNLYRISGRRSLQGGESGWSGVTSSTGQMSTYGNFTVSGFQIEKGETATPYQAARSETDFDGSGLPVGSIWHQTNAAGEVIGTYRYNGATWDPYEVPDTTVPVARFAADRLETLDDGRKVLHLRGAHDYLDEPANPGQFLPSIPALAWRTQPMVIGAVASVPYLGANSDGSVGWLADAPLAHVSEVLDRGDPMEPGTWSVSDDGQQVLLEQPPVGPVVVDASSIGPGMQPASLQEFLHELFSRARRGAWSEDDAAAIDAATVYAGVGFYAGDQVSFREAMAAVLPSYGAWWWEDSTGVLRFSRVVDPEAETPAFPIDGGELASDLVLVPDAAPNLSRRMAYRPNARMLSAGELVTDLVDVPVWRRNELTAAWRGQVYSAQPLAGRYGHADTNPPLVSVFWSPQDAQAEIDRVCALYAQPRAFYQAELAGDLDLAPHPGQVCRLTYDRYGLESGRLLLVRSVERNPVTGQVALTLWG